MTYLLTAKGLVLRCGRLQLQITSTPRAVLVLAALLSAFAFTPRFRATNSGEAAEPAVPVAATEGAFNSLPPFPIRVRNPKSSHGPNELLYLEDFGSNLFTVDSLTGAARLSPASASPQVSGTGLRMPRDAAVPATETGMFAGLPEMLKIGTQAGVARPTARSAPRGQPGGVGASSAGGSSGGGSSGSAAAGSAVTGPPDAASDTNAGAGDDTDPIPVRFPVPVLYLAPGAFDDHSVVRPAAHTATVSGSASPTSTWPALPDTLTVDVGPLPQYQVLPTTALADASPQAPQTLGDVALEATGQPVPRLVSSNIVAPVPEPGTLLPFLTALVLAYSRRRYNTGQKRASSVSEAQPMLKTLILFTALLAVPAFAQKDLPEGTGKPATVRVCTGCHGAEMFSATRLGPTEWDRMIANMTTERGVAITDADYAVVLKYLTTYMAAPKTNIQRVPPQK